MANSLRAKLSKLRHDRHITNEEYQELIKKLDGHDRELKAKAFDEFAKSLIERLEERRKDIQRRMDNVGPTIALVCMDSSFMQAIQDADQIAEQLKEGDK